MRQKYLNNCLIKMIATDLQPYSIVEDPGFIKFTTALCPTFVLPTTTTLSKTLLPQLYDKCVDKVQDLLDNSEHIVLTTDSWTSLSCDGFMAITAQCITKDWKTESVLLNCFKTIENQTAVNLRNSLLAETEKWKITKKVHTVVTDNSENMMAAIKLVGWNHFPCFAHTLNLVVQDAMKTIEPLHCKVKNIVEYFHRNTTGWNKFKIMQVQINNNKQTKPMKLIMDVATRWHTTYFMFERICVLQPPLKATLTVLNNPAQPLNDKEWTELKSCCAILKPFIQVTKEMCEEKYTTLSKVILFIRDLQQYLNNITSLKTNNKKFLDVLVRNMSTRFPAIENNFLLAQATFLDPRFKDKAFTDDENVKKCKDSLLSSMHEAAMIDAEDENSSSFIELLKYTNDEIICRKNDPFLWWKGREILYPNLSKIAKINMGTTATSLPNERFYSTTGQLFFDKRNRLKSDLIEKILFLNANSKAIEL